MTNSEAKQEAIKKAYGKYWETVKNYVDENGYLDKQVFSNYKGITYEEISPILFLHNTLTTCIPLSLQGIENNNGWIRIESEADLPKKNDTYFTKTRHDDIVRIEIIATENLDSKGLEWYKNHYTHYQPIEKPKLPIY